MAKRKKEGSVEIADIYAPRPGTVDIKGVMVGRLAIDYDKREFWERRADRAATRLSAEEVGVLIANDLLVFDQPDMRSTVTEYLMRLTEEKQTIRQAEIDAIKSTRAAEEMEQESRLHKIVKRKARRAKIIWVFACLILIGLAFIATIPAPSLNEAIASIAGVGQDYGIESELLNDVTYIETLGNANKLYGIVLDTDIVEVGQTNTGESTIKENVLINPEISSEPTHLRPLYYDRTNFYQTEIVTNDANTSSSAVYLQNPNGYSLGVPSNELILTAARARWRRLYGGASPWDNKS